MAVTYSYNQESPTSQQMEDLYSWLTANERIVLGAGGGGSGYIANPDTFNKKMVGYNVPTSSDSDTLTQNTTHYSSSAISNYAKMGNGFVRITYLRPAPVTLFQPDFSTDGRDTLRYNPNKTIHIGETASGYDPGGEGFDVICGALFDMDDHSDPAYTIQNNILTIDGHAVAWAYDTTVNQKIIPATCTLWFNFDCYFTNGDGYLDWFMFDDHDIEVIYWCWDTSYSFADNQWYNCRLEATVVNGYITYVSYYVGDTIVRSDRLNIHMVWIDETTPRACKYIMFRTTKLTQIKNMKIYWEVNV